MAISLRQHKHKLEEDWGIHLLAQDYMRPEFLRNFSMAMDAQPVMVSQSNSAIPVWFTTLIDPDVIRILQAPNAGAEILGEEKYGSWTTQTLQFNVSENTGEVAAYGDYSNDGKSDVNFNFPQRQSFHYQTIIEWGTREVDVAGEAKLQLISEKKASGAMTLNKFADASYHFGVSGLQNYGLLNDPSLSAAITPAVKKAGGVKWINNNVIVALATEVYIDIVALFNQLVSQTMGHVGKDDEMTLVMSPGSAVALTATNDFNNNVEDLLKKNFKNLKVKTSPRYATASGNVVQLIADKIDAKKTGVCGFTEKMREGNVVIDLSSTKQKNMGGTWGAIIKRPMAISQMIGV